jgi:hypothetical protein
MKERYPKVGAVKRPANRPFAAYSSHDPEGHLFDLAQHDSQNIRGVWSETPREQERYIKHITIRAIDPEAMAQFYVDLFEFKEEEKALEDPEFLSYRRQGDSGTHSLENSRLSRGGAPRPGIRSRRF